MEEHLCKHFQAEGHKGFLNDSSVTFIDKTDGKDPKKRERYWMRTMKTVEPYGLNIADSVYSRLILYFACLLLFSVHYYFYSLLLL